MPLNTLVRSDCEQASKVFLVVKRLKTVFFTNFLKMGQFFKISKSGLKKKIIVKKCIKQ